MRAHIQRLSVPVVVLAMCVLAPVESRAEDPGEPLSTLQFTAGDLPDVDVALYPREPTAIRASIADMRFETELRNRFVDDYLTPKLWRQLDAIAPAHPAVDNSAEMVDYILYDELTDSAERRARKGVKRAVESYVIESTSLRNLVGSVKSKKKASKPGAGFDVGYGVSHWLPEVELRYRKALSNVRFRVGLHGSAGITFGHERMTKTRVFVGYDAEDEQIDLSLRLGF